jgi:hypothetical protein
LELRLVFGYIWYQVFLLFQLLLGLSLVLLLQLSNLVFQCLEHGLKPDLLILRLVDLVDEIIDIVLFGRQINSALYCMQHGFPLLKNQLQINPLVGELVDLTYQFIIVARC